MGCLESQRRIGNCAVELYRQDRGGILNQSNCSTSIWLGFDSAVEVSHWMDLDSWAKLFAEVCLGRMMLQSGDSWIFHSFLDGPATRTNHNAHIMVEAER